ncbi:hypothetical protein [Ferrimonas lipolytica]|uniref:Cold shock protein, CspA family n=1 Tax=Ferrimonas lipolytica TaxID=2724191 RepID=A0A6H1UA58_9GAMM|nr:hypothetical protein [Ferrimonas lipolytica]QIZ75931.1 hypothetical protein HER31_02965 [Ferrimonas lipolytica]
MRLQGTLFEWHEQGGYGYMRPNGQSDEKVYVDLAAFNYRPHQPSVGDILIVEVQQEGGLLKAHNARMKLGKVAPPPSKKFNPTGLLLMILLVILTAVSLIEFLPLSSLSS